MRAGERPLRLIVGRDTRESGELDRARARPRRAGRPARPITQRRGRADAGDRLRHARDGLRRRHRHLRLAQSVSGQRHQGVLGARARSSPSAGARSRSDRRGGGLGGAGVGRRRPSRSSMSPTRISRTPALALPDPQRLGRFKHRGRYAPTARRRRSRRGCSRSSASTCDLLGANPDGRNINLDCGSTHPEALARAVRDSGARMGIAFDGDGDRAIFVDANGRDRRRRRRAADVRPADEGRRAGSRATPSSRR